MKRVLVMIALVGCKNHDDAQKQPASTGGGQVVSTGSVHYSLKPIDPAESQDLATLKKRTQKIVSEWITEQTTPDGWILTYSTPHMENVQDEKTLKVENKQTGLDYGVYVRRVIDGTPYKCTAMEIPTKDEVARVVEACKTAKP